MKINFKLLGFSQQNVPHYLESVVKQNHFSGFFYTFMYLCYF